MRMLSRLALVGFLLFACSARAQTPARLPAPRLLTVAPPGAKAGTTVEVTFSGQDLDEPQALVFSSKFITAVPVVPPPPPKPDPKVKPPPPPPPATPVTQFKVTVAADCPPGLADVRLVNKWGVSNPRAFMVGDLPEVAEKEPNNDVGEAQRVDLNSTINGAVSAATDVDYYVFAGRRDQRVLVSCLASTIDSRLDPEVAVYDRAAGRLLARDRRYEGANALLDVTLPADGEYFVRVCDFTYTEGSPEHFYRLTLTTGPWIDAVYPPVVEPGKKARVTVYGRNLPGGKPDPTAAVNGRVLDALPVEIDVPQSARALQRLRFSGPVPPRSAFLDGFEYRLRGPTGVSNPFLLTYAAAPVVLDNAANDTPETAQPVAPPCVIAGRIEKPGDRDWYAFQAKKDQVFSVEVLGDRLGSPADLYLLVRNPATKQDLAELDDDPDPLSASKLVTYSQDPARYRFVAPADGIYQLMVSTRDADARWGPRLLYQVRVTPEMPDFRVAVMAPHSELPEAALLRAGGNQYLDVLLWRQDGFAGDVTLEADGLPPGVNCPPYTITAGARSGALVLMAAPTAPPWTGTIRVRATATIGGRKVVREARAASLTWPLPAPNVVAVSRLDRDLYLAVRDKAPFHLAATLDKPFVVHGEKANLKLKLTRLWPDFKGPLSVAPITIAPAVILPPNVTVNGNQPLTIAADKTEATAVVEVQPTAPPGVYPLIVRGEGPVPFTKDPKTPKANLSDSQPTAPVPLTVVPKQLANVTVDTPNATVKAGTRTEVVVRVARLFDFQGEFKVRLVLPANNNGLSTDEVVIPAGKNEARLVVRAAPTAAPGSRANLAVQATAAFDGIHPTTQEAKLNINVVK